MLGDLARGWRGILAIVATYVYFLLFAQYGFLRLLASRLGEGTGLEPAMAAMGLSGFLASLAAGAWLRRIESLTLLRVGFAGCAASAALAIVATGLPVFSLAAAATGLFSGLLTVALAADLRRLLSVRRFGLAVGAGTGIAYFLCNIPILFEGRPELQAAVAAVGCLLALTALPRLPARIASGLHEDHRDAVSCRPIGFAGIVLMFLALIWIDSAAFATIQQTAALKAQTWSGGPEKLLLGTFHLLAALGAGWAIDRKRLFVLPALAMGLFALAFGLLGPERPGAVLAGPIYVVGISIYSTALVAFPSLFADRADRVPSRWRAAWLYGFAGWIGSALGVGMAREIGHVAGPFLAVAGLLLVVGWMMQRTSELRRWAGVYGPALLIAAAGLPVLMWGGPHPVDRSADNAIQRGRQVYINEGCINCHSQFVRPQTDDVAMWGPRSDDRLQGEPPLPGNRRQGPDLSHVGNRRSAPWQRLHLRNPRAVSPGSKMPSYEHLFRDGRGEDLVAYLTSLGRDDATDYWAAVQEFPRRGLVPTTRDHGRALFSSYCTPCHGSLARGDGPYAGDLGPTKAIDLMKPRFLWVPAGDRGEPSLDDLARVIKFGVPGTSMPGHEAFSDQEIADIAGHLLELRRESMVAATRKRP